MPLYARTLLVTGPPDQVRESAGKHREQLEELRARGKVRVAGEFIDGSGFLEIFEAVDRLEAEQIARSSPLIEDGLGTWMLREWRETKLDAPGVAGDETRLRPAQRSSTSSTCGSTQRPCSLISSTRRPSASAVGMSRATISLPTKRAIFPSPQPT